MSSREILPGVRSVAISTTPSVKALLSEPVEPVKPGAQERGKFDQVASLLRRQGGASISEIMTATKWQRTSTRGRLSADVSKLLGSNEVIARWSEAGETYYGIVDIGRTRRN